MKKTLLVLTILMLGAGVAYAGEMPAGWTPPKPSAELERMKSLEGRWIGPGMHKDDKETAVVYHVTSGGTAVEERMSPGTSHEMLSVYRDVKGKLTMTHYCMLGNQPEMELANAAPDKLVLSETPGSASLLGGQARMNGLTLEFPDKDSLVQTWTGLGADGKPMEPSTVLKLKKES